MKDINQKKQRKAIWKKQSLLRENTKELGVIFSDYRKYSFHEVGAESHRKKKIK